MTGMKTITKFVGRLFLALWPQAALAKTVAWRGFVAAGLEACRNGSYAEAQKQYSLALTAAGNFKPRDPRLAMSLSNLARLHWLQGDCSDAEQLQKRALRIFEEIQPPHHPDVIRARFSLSRLNHDMHSFDEAEGLLRKVLARETHALFLPGAKVAEVFSRLAAIYLDRGQLGEAETFSHQALWAWEMILGSDHPDLAEKLAELASILLARGRHDEAEYLYKRKAEILANICSLRGSQSNTVCGNLAGFYDADGTYTEPESLAEQELTYKKRIYGAEHPEIVDSLEQVARLYLARWKFSEAWKANESEALRRLALKIQEKSLGPDHPEIAECLDNLAEVHKPYRENGRVVPIYQRALAIRERELGSKHPDVARSLHNVADQYGQVATVGALGRTREPEQLTIFRRALEIREAAFGPDHLDVAESLECLASVYDVNDQIDKAEPLYKRALAIRQKCLPQEHPEVDRSLGALGRFYWRSEEKPAKAEPVFRRLLTLREKILGPNHPDVAECLQDLGEICHSQNKFAEALPFYERALAIRETFDFELPPWSGDLGDNLVRIASLHQDQGNISEAEKTLRRALTMQQLEYQPGDPRVAQTLKSLADLYHAGGKIEEAQPLYEQLIDSWKNSRWMAYPPSEVPTTLIRLGDIYIDQGRGTEAEFLYRHAIGIWEKGLSTEQDFYGDNVLEITVSLFEEQGRDAEADPLAEHALVRLQSATWPEHEQLVKALERYAALLRDTGRIPDAERLELEANAIRGRATDSQSNTRPVRALKQVDSAENVDLEVEATGDGATQSQCDAMSVEALKLIDQMIANLDLSEDSREELRGYKRDIEQGQFDEGDWSYLQAFNARLSKRQ